MVTRIGGLELDPAGEFARRVIGAGRRAGVPARMAEGLFSDAFTLAAATGLPALNIIVGYHEPHSPLEYVSLPELRRAMRWVSAVLETVVGADKHAFLDCAPSAAVLDLGCKGGEARCP